MTAYVDSSVFLRLTIGAPGRLRDWGAFSRCVCSELAMVESLRTIDRFRVVAEISEEEAVRRRKVLLEMLAACDMVEVSRRILARAAEPFAVALGTLDAIHLATALGWQEENAEAVVMATHDGALARAARAYGMEVKGV